MVDGHVYPNHNKTNRFDLYSELLAHFIRDVRKDLNVPKMPFVIGVMGVGGLKDESVDMLAFRRAMAAPAAMPEFKGNVEAVHTADFWDEKLGELENRKLLAREMPGRRKKTNDSYDGLRKKLAPLLQEMAEFEKRPKAERSKAKHEELEKKIWDTLYTPEEQEYYAKNRCAQAFHYNGSAKTYCWIGEALANAVLGMSK